MKLSEAIRLGSMMKPQCFGLMHDDGATCAFGAALDAIGKLHECYSEEPQEWHDTGAFIAECPQCHDTMRYVDQYKANTLAHLNDTHRWTREQIADWVSTIEAQTEQPATEQPVEVRS